MYNKYNLVSEFSSFLKWLYNDKEAEKVKISHYLAPLKSSDVNIIVELINKQSISCSSKLYNYNFFNKF